MERLTIDEVIAHCKRNTQRWERTEKDRVRLGGKPINFETDDMSNNFMKEYWEHRQVAEWLEQLKDYKDAEEQGLILRLPCKVEDTIYKIPSKVTYKLNVLNGYLNNNKVYEQKIYYIKMYNSSRYLIATCEGLYSVLSDEYKKTWFLTREEAEQALKRMESE